MVVRTDTSEYETKIAIGIGPFRTQKVIQSRKLDSLLRHEVHGASFATLRGNEVSDTLLMNLREEDKSILSTGCGFESRLSIDTGDHWTVVQRTSGTVPTPQPG
jgi:hypothetical protein